MILNQEVHNFREWIGSDGINHSDIIVDITPDAIDLAGSYGDKHLCFISSDVDINPNKIPIRIPITIPLTDGVLTVQKVTKIKRNYLLSGGAGVFASLDLLKPFLTAKDIKTLNDAIADALKQYKNLLPDKPDPATLRKQEKQARIIAKLQSGVAENVLDTIAFDVGGV